jgi:hypothetical protein
VAPTETTTAVIHARVETPTAVKTATKYSEASSAGHSRSGMKTTPRGARTTVDTMGVTVVCDVG